MAPPIMLALDRAGRVVMDKTVQVLGASGGDLVVVYKGVERETYSCAPDCERRITLGDSQGYFNDHAGADRRPHRPGADGAAALIAAGASRLRASRARSWLASRLTRNSAVLA